MAVKLPDATSLGARPSLQPGTSVASYQVGNSGELAGRQTMAEGAQLGQAAAQFGEMAKQFEHQVKLAQAETDRTVAEAAWNKYRSSEQEITFGEDGTLISRGADAFGAVKATRDRLQQARSRIGEGMTDEQRKLFHARADVTDLAANERALRHVAAERQAFERTTMKGSEAAATAQVGADPANPNTFALARDTLHAQARNYLRFAGVSDPGAQQAYLQELNDGLATARYAAWQQIDAAAALGDFQQNAKSISPVLRERIGSQLYRAAAPQLAAQINAAGGVGALPVPNANGIPDPAAPRGLRNNNPGNIQKGAKPWQGEVEGTDQRYVTFATPEAGIRAMGKTLLTYQDKHGLNTVEAIISRWAPATENDTAAYIAAVAKAVGVNPDDTINVRDPATLTALTRAMVQHENGRQPYSAPQIAAGLGAALGTAELPAAAASKPATQVDVAGYRDPNVKTGHPIVDSLAPDERLHVMQLAQSQIRQDMTQARDALQTRLQDSTAEYLARGTASNPPSDAELVRAFGQAEGMRRAQELKDTATLGARIQQTLQLNDAELDRLLRDAKPAAGEGFATRERNYQLLGRAVEHVRKARADDSMAFALHAKAYGIKPLTKSSFSSPQGIAEDLGARGKVFMSIAADYGTPPAVMAKAEAEAFGDYVATLQAPDKARVLGQVAAAVGPVGMMSLSQQLKDKNSTLAIAGMLASRVTTQGRNVAQLYLEGKEMLAEKRAKIDAAAETGVKATIFKALDGVYTSPQARDAAEEAAFGIFAKLKSEGSNDVKQAINIATGGLMDFNGGKIAKPSGWSDSQFRDFLTDSLVLPRGPYLVGGVKTSAEDLTKTLPGAKLQTFGDGTYLIKAGIDVVRNADGSPFILKVGR